MTGRCHWGGPGFLGLHTGFPICTWLATATTESAAAAACEAGPPAPCTRVPAVTTQVGPRGKPRKATSPRFRIAVDNRAPLPAGPGVAWGVAACQLRALASTGLYGASPRERHAASTPPKSTAPSTPAHADTAAITRVGRVSLSGSPAVGLSAGTRDVVLLSPPSTAS